MRGVSRDGKYLLFGQADIMMLPLQGPRKQEPSLRTRYTEANPVFSPDGRWVAYNSDESGRPEVYIQAFPERRGKWMISDGGGRAPRWRADGKELYWLAPGDVLTAASLELQPAGVRPGRPETLFRLSAGGQLPFFDPAANGRRFLVLVPEGGQEPIRPMVVVQNWAAGLGK